MKNHIVLVRGLPGSGKSTHALSLESQGYSHFEADMYLIVDGKYVYDKSKIRQAHDWCFISAKTALEKGLNVVVSNTFIKKWEMQRYIDIGYPFQIVKMNGKWKNIHGVPQETIDSMAHAMEAIPTLNNGLI